MARSNECASQILSIMYMIWRVRISYLRSSPFLKIATNGSPPGY